jgi:hypothetical protein
MYALNPRITVEAGKGVHFQRTTALRAATIAAYKFLYAPLASTASPLGR